MGRRLTRRILEKHATFARETANFAVEPGKLGQCKSWDDMHELALTELASRDIIVRTKRKGWITWLRFDSRATMVPGANGPLMLPWDWQGKSQWSKTRTLLHELTHHSQDVRFSKYGANANYEALYLHPAWRWAIECQCFGYEVWVMVASQRFTAHPYSDAQIERWIGRLSKSIKRSYSLRRFDKQHVIRETRAILEWHYNAAHQSLG